MDPLTAVAASEAIQGVTGLVNRALGGEESSEVPVEGSSFDLILRNAIQPDSANNVNEEELFAGLIQERLTTLKGEEAGNQYKEALDARKAEMARGDGYIPVEAAANQALNDMVSQGVVDSTESVAIRSQAFSAAQLDNIKDKLFDGRGSGPDPTIALMSLEAAMTQAKTKMDAFDSGEAVPDVDLSKAGETSSIEATDGSGGFLFKPESDNGPLVVLLPSEYANDVQSVALKNKNGKVIEEGWSSGYANPDSNGEREHWRFSLPGAEYPQDLTVEIKFSDGSLKLIEIPDPSKRYD